jgi:4-amino-4-deoxy-L-arabinose transferase-like glycosyltransferase
MSKRFTSIILLVLLCALIASIIVLSLVPPVSKDELVHHLAVPELYLKHGGMYEIPFMSFSYYPMNLDLLYLIPLYFGNDIVPKFIHFAFALLTALLIFRYLNKRTGPAYALFGILFFLSIPIIIKLSITAYVDLGLIFFSFASLYFLMEWTQRPSKKIYLVLSAVMSGLAMGTKYNGLITFLLVALFVPFLYSRVTENRKRLFLKSAIHGLSFVFIGLLVFSPWMARNYAWKQNPLYPQFERVFNPPKNGKTENGGDQALSIRPGLGPFVIREGIYHESGWEIALLPARVFWEGQDGSPKHFDGKLSPFLLILPILAFWRMPGEDHHLIRERKILVLFSVLFFAFALFTSDLRIRYIGPIIPPLVILSVFGLSRIPHLVSRVRRRDGYAVETVVSVLVAVGSLGFNTKYLYAQFQYVAPLSYLRGQVSREEYISRYRPEQHALRYINHHLAPDARVLFLFLGNRGYYCERDYVFGVGMLGSAVGEARNAEDVLFRLQSQKVTHLLVNNYFLQRWAQNNLSDGAKRILNEFFEKYATIIYSENGFSVLGLSSN